MIKAYSLTAKATLLQTDETWWVTCVYGPQAEQEKIQFFG